MSKAAADIIQFDTTDAYRNITIPNGCKQGFVEYIGFHFRMKQFLRIIEGKCSNHTILQSLEPGTCACAIGRLECRVAKGVMNFTDDSINVNTIIIDVLRVLE
jgi:hypothetical protein